MKTLFRKKWFRRLCQTCVVLASLFVLAYVAINWWGARAKRDVIARMRAEGRPTSIAEMLKPMPRDEDNFAMIPILARARDEWWFDKSHGQAAPPDQARAKLQKMACKTNKRYLAREGNPDPNIWKQNFGLTGSDAECLDGYDRKFGEILAELRSGMSRPETASISFHRLAASSNTELVGLTAAYSFDLTEVAESLGFRAELALAAGRPDVAHESLSMAIRLSELIGSEGTLVGQLIQGRVNRHLQPTLARALQTGGWDKAGILSIRNEFARLEVLDGFRRALDVENFITFAMFGEMKTHPAFLAWGNVPNVSAWQQDFLARIATKLPDGWYQNNAAMTARLGLQLRDELGDGGDLHSWLKACERAEGRAQLTSNWEYWLHPMKNNSFGQILKNACRNQSIVQMAMLACDLEIHRLDHGRYPERLQETGSPLITDSMTGQPFIYQIAGSGFLLYSIGSDGKDDGGTRLIVNVVNQPDWIW